MRKTIATLILLVLLVAVVPMSALAGSRYCPICDKTQNWSACCYGTKFAASLYGACGDVANCNWYTLYNYNGEKCPTCINKWRLSTGHACKGLHSVTNPYHNYNFCPY